MTSLAQGFARLQEGLFSRLAYLDGLAPLALRVFLFFPLWMAGTQKLAGIENTIEWFGNPDWGLGLPFPTLLAYLAAYTEALLLSSKRAAQSAVSRQSVTSSPR